MLDTCVRGRGARRGDRAVGRVVRGVDGGGTLRGRMARRCALLAMGVLCGDPLRARCRRDRHATHCSPRGATRAEPRARESIDYLGAALGTLALAGLVGALMAGPALGARDWRVLGAGVGGVLAWRRSCSSSVARRTPILPLSIFRSQQFSGVNATTFLVYAALSGLVLSPDAAAAGQSALQRAACGRGAHAGERDHARASRRSRVARARAWARAC